MIKNGILWILLTIATLFFIVSASDLVSYYLEPGDFVFGTEVAGFTYATSSNFVLSNIAQAAVSLIVAVLAILAIVHRYRSRD
jgi:hypothetical protein